MPKSKRALVSGKSEDPNSEKQRFTLSTIPVSYSRPALKSLGVRRRRESQGTRGVFQRVLAGSLGVVGPGS